MGLKQNIWLKEKGRGQCRPRGLESTSIWAVTEQAVSKDVH